MWLLACAGGDQVGWDSDDARAWSGLSEGNSWTWRDDALGRPEELEEPDSQSLTMGQHLGEGVIELRIGSRWADAEPAGELVFSDIGGIVLQSWDLQGQSGTGPLQISEPTLDEDVAAVSENYACTYSGTETVETWYGDFDFAAVFRCAGSGMDGTWAFGADVGLIQADVGGIQLDLVAPY